LRSGSADVFHRQPGIADDRRPTGMDITGALQGETVCITPERVSAMTASSVPKWRKRFAPINSAASQVSRIGVATPALIKLIEWWRS